MFTNRFPKAAILSLLLIIVSVLSFGVCTINAEESPYLDLEGDPSIKLTYNMIEDKRGVILNEAAIESNLHVLDQYLTFAGGEVIIPNREPGNVLGWRLTNIEGKNYTLEPFFLLNADINKQKIDYVEEMNTVQETDFATDFMSATVSFSVYGTDWFQHQSKVATVYIRYELEYYDIGNPNYDYYLGKYEITVAPVSGTYLNEFYMALMLPADNQNCPDMSVIATNNTPKDETDSSQLGTKYTFPIDSPSEGEGSVEVVFSYSSSAPDGSSTLSITSTDVIANDSSFNYTTFAVEPSDDKDDGDSYTGLMHIQYRVPSWQSMSGCGIAFYGLDLGGNIGKPGYNKENTDCAMIAGSWYTPFDDRGIMILSGTSDNIPSDDVIDQGFADYSFYCSLPNKSAFGPAYWYSE